MSIQAHQIYRDVADTFTGFFSREVDSRAKYLEQLPIDICTAVVHTIFAAVYSTLSVATLGASSKLNRAAYNRADGQSKGIAKIYSRALHVLNPNASYVKYTAYQSITERIANPILKNAVDSSKKTAFLDRHVVARGAFALGALVAVATSIADLALGSIGTLFSLITLGCSERLNTFTRKHLFVLAVVENVFIGARGFIRPSQGSPEISSRRTLHSPGRKLVF